VAYDRRFVVLFSEHRADEADDGVGDCPTVCVTGRDPRVRDRVSRAGEDHDRDHFF
jgi:hypothetical protein